MDLRGYLLDAGPGLGKTINSIALMELLGADKIIVVCPKKQLSTYGKKPLIVFIVNHRLIIFLLILSRVVKLN